VQFVKYVAFGAVTTFVHLGIFAWLSHTWFPAHDYLAPGGLPDELKQRHALISNLFAFPPAATVNYFFNIAFVFTTGRHSRLREFALFILVSLLSFAAGLFCGPFLISRGLDPWLAQGGLMVSSALVNFLCRKFLVFLR
jgi:putative flippase GtrA